MSVTPLKVYCQKILPAVYDDSLSYYEVICKFLNKLNELIEAFNELEPDEYVKKEELEKILTDLYNNLKNYIDTENDSQTVFLKSYVLQKLLVLKNELEEEIKNTQLSDVLITNPENSAKKQNIQNVIYRYNQYYRMISDCCYNIDILEMTAAQRDGLMLSAYQFDFSNTGWYSKGNLEPLNYYDGNYAILVLRSLINGETLD